MTDLPCKIVLRHDPETGTSRTLAQFRIKGCRLQAEWHSDSFKQDVEQHGIVTADGVLFPKDGEVFFNNLDVAFSYATYTEVISEPSVKVTTCEDAREATQSAATRSRYAAGAKRTRLRTRGTGQMKRNGGDDAK
jgi:hypothetical protein